LQNEQSNFASCTLSQNSVNIPINTPCGSVRNFIYNYSHEQQQHLLSSEERVGLTYRRKTSKNDNSTKLQNTAGKPMKMLPDLLQSFKINCNKYKTLNY
jgi:hypothetical protein